MTLPQTWPFVFRGTITLPRAKAPEAVIDALERLVAADGGGATRLTPQVLALAPHPSTTWRVSNRVAEFSDGTFTASLFDGQASVTFSVSNGSKVFACTVGPTLACLMSTHPFTALAPWVLAVAFSLIVLFLDAGVSFSRIESIVREALASA